MPTARQAYVPQPLVDRSAADLRGYIEGADPVSNRPFMQEILEGLSSPLTKEDETGVSFERSTPRLLKPDDEDNLQQLYIDNYWTDFFPVTLPTVERVDKMLAGTSHEPPIAQMPITAALDAPNRAIERSRDGSVSAMVETATSSISASASSSNRVV